MTTQSDPIVPAESDNSASAETVPTAANVTADSVPATPATSDTPAEPAPASDFFGGRTALEVAADPQPHPTFDQFVATIAALRAPGGCPWDREQTHTSIADNMIEEAYEAVDAIEAADIPHMREELGDVLLQVVLQSQMAAEAGQFDINDVAADVNDKIVRRHPHVFGDVKAGSAGEVLDVWDAIKLAEKQAARATAAESAQAGAATSDTPSSAAPASGADAPTAPAPEPGILDGVPASFPALMQAQKISRKAAAAGFEWDSVKDVWAKVREEEGELRQAYDAAPKGPTGKVEADGTPTREMRALNLSAEQAVANVEEELGDLLFTLVNVARKMGLNAEGALRASCAKFRRRFAAMEQAAREQGVRLEDLDTARQNALWDRLKEEGRA